MHTQAPLDKLALLSGRAFSQRQNQATAPSASAADRPHEIYSYIAVRDLLLASAESTPSRASLDSAAVANDLVETYLKPARSPYEAQHLARNESLVQQRRCDAARGRIAGLRAALPRAA